MARDCKSVIWRVHHMLYGAYGVGKLPEFYHKNASTVLEAVSSHLALATERKLFLHASSQDESKI